VGCFGEGTLGIALTDTFGTPEFLKAFAKPVRHVTGDEGAHGDRAPSLADSFISVGSSGSGAGARAVDGHGKRPKTYAEVFTGVRQDSGDPVNYVKVMRKFYDEQGITDKKVIVFSDSLNIDRCLEYKRAAEEGGFQPTFGVGTFFTNDFVHTATGKKSTPLNIVIKLSSAAGRPAIKIRCVFFFSSLAVPTLLLFCVEGRGLGA
jgi:nicotinate phosphoribosyltransferase